MSKVIYIGKNSIGKQGEISVGVTSSLTTRHVWPCTRGECAELCFSAALAVNAPRCILRQAIAGLDSFTLGPRPHSNPHNRSSITAKAVSPPSIDPLASLAPTSHSLQLLGFLRFCSNPRFAFPRKL